MIRFVWIFLGAFFSLSSLYSHEQLTINEFLQSAKASYQQASQNSEVIHFVMGNESADLDSFVSSIAYAYLLKNERPQLTFIPLINLYREEMTLRKDILLLLKTLNISTDHLLFLDDGVPLDSFHNEKRLRFNLVDHNLLRPRQEHLAEAVESIIDHHADEDKKYPLLESKLIAVVGSATTLVTEKILSAHQITMTPELATFLLAPILMDTANLQSAEKTTVRDILAAETLKLAALDTIPHNFYDMLLSAKNNVSGLSPEMLLSKDFKEYLDGKILYGIASLPPAICWGAEDISSLQGVLKRYASERQLAFLIVLMAHEEPRGPKRRIIIYSPSGQLLSACAHYIQTDETLRGILIPWSEACNPFANFYFTEQFISRKQLQPMFHFSENQDIRSFLEEN